jgi:hypothetical protein
MACVAVCWPPLQHHHTLSLHCLLPSSKTLPSTNYMTSLYYHCLSYYTLPQHKLPTPTITSTKYTFPHPIIIPIAGEELTASTTTLQLLLCSSTPMPIPSTQPRWSRGANTPWHCHATFWVSLTPAKSTPSFHSTTMPWPWCRHRLLNPTTISML